MFPIARPALGGKVGWGAKQGGDEIEVGGFADGKTNLKLHDVRRDGILVLTEGGKKDLIERQVAGADQAIDFDGEG